MKLRISTLVLATLTFSAFAFAGNNQQSQAIDTGYQVRYFANITTPGAAATAPDSYINIVNDGTLGVGGFGIGGPTQLCANLYAFAPDEELLSCCSCQLTADSVQSLSVDTGLLNTVLTGGLQTSIMVAMVTTNSSTCNPATITSNSISQGLKAWGTTAHAVSIPPAVATSYQLTETDFVMSNLSGGQLAGLAAECEFLGVLGSGAGQCKGCSTGALGASKE